MLTTCFRFYVLIVAHSKKKKPNSVSCKAYVIVKYNITNNTLTMPRILHKQYMCSLTKITSSGIFLKVGGGGGEKCVYATVRNHYIIHIDNYIIFS